MARIALSLHVLERGNKKENLAPVAGRRGIWESGYWVVGDVTAEQLIGRKIYVHRGQKLPAHKGGTILEVFHRAGSALNRKVFVFRAEEQLVGTESPTTGWGREKCMKWEEAKKLPFPISKQGDESAFPEGKKKFRQHELRERDSALVRRAKALRLQRAGKLECDACKFDFAKAFGARGAGFIEAHHKVPVALLDGKVKTLITDLALVCSNCHRMLHRGKPLLTIDDLKVQLKRGS
jgi:hypothetical protein